MFIKLIKKAITFFVIKMKNCNICFCVDKKVGRKKALIRNYIFFSFKNILRVKIVTCGVFDVIPSLENFISLGVKRKLVKGLLLTTYHSGPEGKTKYFSFLGFFCFRGKF